MQAHPQSSSAARNLSVFPPPQPSPASTQENSEDTTHAGAPSLAEGAGLAHDAGNLLGALSLYCDLLEAPGVLDARHRHYAAELRLIYERSGALLSRLLHLTPDHLDTRTVHLSPATGKAAPLHQTPAETLRTLAPLLSSMAAPYAHVTIEVAPRLPHIELSAEALERITVNLVRNAAEAIHTAQLAGGHIHVCLNVVAGRLRLSVEDNGPGMPPALAAAFLHPAPLPPGTSRGFGHRNVHELADATGGRLGIHVRPGRGTTLCLEWPIPADRHAHLGHHAQPRFASAHLAPPPPIAALRLRPAGLHHSRRMEGEPSA
jgi:nitrogen-specific signal transduction histidine kinase